ncbi:MAG: hypothetical protein C0596_01700 [Marinilabiliales bacterium]|nr:MAG: hypothetical protein C0596_01700 [Marinilabiliales bacterium]
MIHEFKTVSLIIAFIFPFVWGVTFLIEGISKERSKKYLFILMLSASFTYMMTFFKFENFLETYAILFPIQTGVVFILFPLLFLYVKSLTSEKPIHKLESFLHFIPGIVMFIGFSILQKFVIEGDVEVDFVKYLLDKEVIIGDHFILGKTIYSIGKPIMVVSALVYVGATIIKMRKHYIKVKELFSENEIKELRWIRGLGYIFAAMIIFFVVIHILENNQVEAHNGLIGMSYLTFGLFFWYLGLNGFRQKEVYNVSEVAQSDEFKAEAKISKAEIEDYLLRTKAYQNQNISVFDMCYHFHTNRTYLSDAIRLNFSTNFRGLINHYRTEDAKKSIDENVANNIDFDLENIATNAGFSSYSTFFRVFRSETGITPSDYIKFITKMNKKS